jgi:adenine-specific DNA-methyltransferase
MAANKGSLPLIWAAAIRPDGHVDYQHMCSHVPGSRALVDDEVSYVVRGPCILVQRTSNRKQKRRINAAVVDQRILNAIGPFVTENHVIVLTPPSSAASQDVLREMARVLNSAETTALYDRICGTASVSIKTLLQLKLPQLSA